MNNSSFYSIFSETQNIEDVIKEKFNLSDLEDLTINQQVPSICCFFIIIYFTYKSVIF